MYITKISFKGINYLSLELNFEVIFTYRFDVLAANRGSIARMVTEPLDLLLLVFGQLKYYQNCESFLLPHTASRCYRCILFHAFLVRDKF